MRAPITYQGITTGEVWTNKIRENGWAKGQTRIRITHIDPIDEEVEYLRLTTTRIGDPLTYMSIHNLLGRYEKVE